jgi:hypothetical protein
MLLKGKSWNRIVLTIFAPLLILVGVLGFVLPAESSLTSGAPAYNIFHLIFGVIGLACVWSGREGLIKLFNLGFGAIDLYQAVASFLHLFPEEHFRWKPADDILHIVIGAALVLVAIFGTGKSRPV